MPEALPLFCLVACETPVSRTWAILPLFREVDSLQASCIFLVMGGMTVLDYSFLSAAIASFSLCLFGLFCWPGELLVDGFAAILLLLLGVPCIVAFFAALEATWHGCVIHTAQVVVEIALCWCGMTLVLLLGGVFARNGFADVSSFVEFASHNLIILILVTIPSAFGALMGRLFALHNSHP